MFMERKHITNLVEAQHYISLLSNKLAIDIETHHDGGLTYSKQKLRGVTFCDHKYNIYIDFYENDVLLHPVIELLKDFFKHKKRVIMHNASFDLAGLYKYGLDLSNQEVWDTMTGDHLIDENKKHGLKELAKVYLGVEVKDYSADVSLDAFAEYAMNDSLWTYQIYKMQVPILERLGMLNLMLKVECPYNHVLTQMRVAGVPINWELLASHTIKAKDILLNTEIELLKSINAKFFVQFDLLGNEMKI